ncbi:MULTISPECIES: hypothetical protein [unclassified Haladaptatus]|nr:MULTISPECIES: hypothetical protein [unclassified Haladaptatus]
MHYCDVSLDDSPVSNAETALFFGLAAQGAAAAGRTAAEPRTPTHWLR